MSYGVHRGLDTAGVAKSHVPRHVIEPFLRDCQHALGTWQLGGEHEFCEARVEILADSLLRRARHDNVLLDLEIELRVEALLGPGLADLTLHKFKCHN